MSRICTVKPQFFKHKRLFEAEKKIGLPLRLAFIGLLTCCDWQSHFRWDPYELKRDVLPFDEVDFEKILHALEFNGFIEKFESNGGLYGCFPGWYRHQRHHREELDF